VLVGTLAMGLIVPPPDSGPNTVTLPRNPTDEQLRDLLSHPLVMPGGLVVGVSSGEPPADAPLRSTEMAVSAYSTLSTITGRASSPELLIRLAAQWGWGPTVFKLSRLACLVARDGPLGASTRAMTIEPLLERTVVLSELETRVLDYVRAFGTRMAVAHGDVLYFLQAVALLYGADTGREPTNRELAFWMLAAGDHLPGWQTESDPPVTPLESGVALMARASLFTSNEDVGRSLARARLLFEGPPHRGRFSNATEWDQLQCEAFGSSFLEYLEDFVTPLTLSAAYWGTQERNGVVAAPLIHPSTWLGQTKLDSKRPLEELERLVISRDEARTALKHRLTPEGLPRAPSFFYRQPFVRLAPDAVTALSPMAVYGQLRSGIWARFLEGAKRRTGKAIPWFEAFGYLTEAWCQRVARDAVTAGCPDRIVEVPGEEVEDLVLANGNAVALFSVKSRLMDERHLRQASSPGHVIDWFNEVLFRERTSESDRYRGGALRQLDAAVRRVQAGRYEPLLPRGVEVFPVLVTFEEVFDSFWLQQWVAETCSRCGLFMAERVRPVVLASVSNLELLLGMAAHGVSVLDVLRTKASTAWRQRPLQHVMAQMSKRLSGVRPPVVEAAFRDVMDRATMKMFGRQLPDPEQGD
jgi:hypothetical protein